MSRLWRTFGKTTFLLPGCGNKVSQAVREQVEQHSQRTIPIDNDTLLDGRIFEMATTIFLSWSFIFPFTRQSGWQLIEKIGRRAGITGLHPHSLRHLLGPLGWRRGLTQENSRYCSTCQHCYHYAYVDSNFDQLKAEYQRLWDSKDDNGPKE